MTQKQNKDNLLIIEIVRTARQLTSRCPLPKGPKSLECIVFFIIQQMSRQHCSMQQRLA